MRFKDYFRLVEEDKGIMGYGVPYPKKPSDGQPFKNLGPVAGGNGQSSAGPQAGGSQQPMFMRKRMKKH